MIVVWAQFVDIAAHDAQFGTNQCNSAAKLVEADTARFRCSGSREDRWVQNIQVEGEVNRFVFELFHNLFQSGKVKAVCFDVGSAPGKFLAIARTNAKLEDLSVSGQFPAASEDAGMGEFNTEVVIPQISVSVKVDDVDIWEFFKNSAESAEGY